MLVTKKILQIKYLNNILSYFHVSMFVSFRLSKAFIFNCMINKKFQTNFRMCVPSSICTSESEDGRGWKASLGMTWPNTTAQKRPPPGMETSEAL